MSESELEQVNASTLSRRTLLAGAAAGSALLATGLAGRPALAQEALAASRFSITIDGHEIATFSELVGIVSEVVPAEYAAPDRGPALKRLLGTRKPSTVTLKRGLNDSLELWAWHEAVLLGDLTSARRSCSLSMFDTAGSPVAVYHLEDAWPSKIEVGALKAGSSEVLLETVTLVADAIQRVAP